MSLAPPHRVRLGYTNVLVRSRLKRLLLEVRFLYLLTMRRATAIRCFFPPENPIITTGHELDDNRQCWSLQSRPSPLISIFSTRWLRSFLPNRSCYGNTEKFLALDRPIVNIWDTTREEDHLQLQSFTTLKTPSLTNMHRRYLAISLANISDRREFHCEMVG